MSTADVDAVVVGAGISGLAAALTLQAGGHEVTVIDPSDRPGGVMRTDHAGGYVVERGPNTTLVKAPMRVFLEQRGLDQEMLRARPASRLRYVMRRGRLVQVPGSPLSLLTTSLVSPGAKLRALLEPLVRRNRGDEETVAEFVGRRLGREMVSGLVGPFLTGVYAGDETQLGARAVFPGLVESEQRFGSLALGALFTRRAKGLKGSWSAPAGFGPFARKISDHLAEPPALGSRVVAIARDGSGFRVDVTSRSGDVTLSTSRVVVATPALEAATILRGVDAEVSSSLEQLRYAPIATVPLGVARRDLTEGLRGFGFLVPREEERALLGCLFMSQLFPDRAPEGCELLHCMLGGTRWPDAVSQGDDTLVERAVADLEGAIGLRGAPENLGVGRWERAIPQPGPEHPARMRWVQQRLAEEAPRLALAGAYVAGVSVSDALASGLAAGERVLSA